MNDDILNLFFKEKTLKIFLSTEEEEYASKIRNKAVCMYSYVITTLRKFEKLGLVASKKEGRIKKYTLTEKGKEIQGKIKKLLDII
jgi:predicted transcriptional regulator